MLLKCQKRPSLSIPQAHELTMKVENVSLGTLRNQSVNFQVWLPLPVICAGISIYLVVAPLVDNWSNAYLLAMLIIFAGLIFYIPFVWLDWTLPWGLFEKIEILDKV